MNESVGKSKIFLNSLDISDAPRSKVIVNPNGQSVKMQGGKMQTGKMEGEILNSSGMNIKGQSRSSLPPIVDKRGLPLSDAPTNLDLDDYLHPGWEDAAAKYNEKQRLMKEFKNNPTGKKVSPRGEIYRGSGLKNNASTSYRASDGYKQGVAKMNDDIAKARAAKSSATKSSAKAGAKASAEAGVKAGTKASTKAGVKAGAKQVPKSAGRSIGEFISNNRSGLMIGSGAASVALALGMMIGNNNDD